MASVSSDKRAGSVMLKSRVQILLAASRWICVRCPEFTSLLLGNSHPFSSVSFTSFVDNGHQQSSSAEKLNLKANKGGWGGKDNRDESTLKNRNKRRQNSEQC